MSVTPNPAVDRYIELNGQWADVLSELRSIVQTAGTNLVEEYKWKQPVYTYQGVNVLIIGCMKQSCVLGFPKGSLLPDPDELLVKAGDSVRDVRRMHFQSIHEVKRRSRPITQLVRAAIEIEMLGKGSYTTSDDDLIMPEEFAEVLDNRIDVRNAFAGLSPSCRRQYLLYFSEAKKSATRRSRIERSLDAIVLGKRVKPR